MALPITVENAKVAAGYLMDTWGDLFRQVRFGPFQEELFCAIACQESAYLWLKYIEKLTPQEILARCLVNRSGSFAGKFFPTCIQEFRSVYGDALTERLLLEGNKTRKLQGMPPWKKLYTGYGIFGFDLHYIQEDRAFFERREWRSMEACLERLVGVLKPIWEKSGVVVDTLRRYKGSGRGARLYAQKVLYYERVFLSNVQ